MTENIPGGITGETSWEALGRICKRIPWKIEKNLEKFSNKVTAEFSDGTFGMGVFFQGILF